MSNTKADKPIARIDGPFRIFQAEGQVSRRRAHPSFDGAVKEARRLTAVQPGDAFIIMQEVAQVGRGGGEHG